MQRSLAHLKLNHYRLLNAIAETGQLSLAADTLSLTQPAASRMLSQMEDIVGQPLFLRHPKGMTPGLIGEVLVRHARTLLSDLAQTEEEVIALQGGKSGTIRVGAVTGAAVSYVVPAVEALRKQTSGVDVRLDVSPSDELMSGLVAGHYDFVLARIPPNLDSRQFHITRGRIEEIRFLVRAGHPLAGQSKLEIEDLQGFGWVVQAVGTPMRQAVEEAFLASAIMPPKDIITTTSLLVMIASLRGSDLIAPMSHEVRDLLDTAVGASLRSFSLRQTLIVSPYHLVQRRDREISPIAIQLGELVLEKLSYH